MGSVLWDWNHFVIFVAEGKAGIRSGNCSAGDRGRKNNAALNGITNAQFYVGKAEEVLPAFYNSNNLDAGMRHPDVIVVDPPRKGCDEQCLSTMLAMKPQRIVYVSCDSATLARDLRILVDGGYELRKVRAF